MNTFTATLFFLFLMITLPIRAVVYYVDRNHPAAADANPGTSRDRPWVTIAKANATVRASDTVYVFPGVYEESINPVNSGTVSQFIAFVADPSGGVVVRQAGLLHKTYIRIIGFEITHASLAFTHAVTLYGSSHCQILHNTIHHINGQAIRNNAYYGNADHNVIRGNVISYMGCPQTGNPQDWTGANAVVLLGSYNLVEYNDVSHTLDFFDLNGGFNVIRNNYTHEFANTDFSSGPGDGAHVDFWQPFSSPGNLTRRNIIESNWARDIYERNSHFFQVRDEHLLGIDELIIRGNVGTRFGSYVAQFGAADHTRLYNNTFVDFGFQQTKPWTTVAYRHEPAGTTTDPSAGNQNFNNIFFQVCRPDGHIIFLEAGCSAEISYNAAEGSGSHPGCPVTANINFRNAAVDDYLLLSSSACIDAGKWVTTIVSPTGNGNSFMVVDAGFFSTGNGVVEGDLIRVGANPTVRIIEIVGNTITVDRSVSWNTGDPVNWRNQDPHPDIGAYEVGDSMLAAATITRSGNEYSVGVNGDTRFVIFFLDGMPCDTDYESPYTATIDGGVVTAKAYALHAQPDPVVDAVPAASDSQTITLVPGWNWISFNVLPADRSLDAVFAGILTQIEQVKNQTQSALRLNGQWVGDLTSMDGIQTGKMYKVRVNAACTLTVTGAQITSTTPISLTGGWNWVAFYPSASLPINQALSSITTSIQQAKSQTQSAIYNGGAWMGDLTQLEPEKGYTIRMNGPGTLIY